jgi:hypothetical protein
MIEIRPDMVHAFADFDELRNLSARFGFGLAETLRSLLDDGLPVFRCEIDDTSATLTGYAVARYELTERLHGVLTALRARDRDNAV